MKRNLVFRVSLLANAALVTLLLFVAARPQLHTQAIAFEATEAGRLKQASQDLGRNSFTFVCSDRRDDFIETGARFVELQLDLALSQKGLLREVKETLQNSTAIAFTEFCNDFAASTTAQRAPEKLAMYQALSESATLVFDQVRPAFDRFYRSLSVAQQQELDQMLNRQNR
ncbi:MAG: Spy/CpxP family protein refolding chaperone [Almyronema sp.]